MNDSYIDRYIFNFVSLFLIIFDSNSDKHSKYLNNTCFVA